MKSNTSIARVATKKPFYVARESQNHATSQNSFYVAGEYAILKQYSFSMGD